MNIAIISGNLTRDPDCRYTNGNPPKPVVKFTVASNYAYNGEKKADFINVTVFREATANYIKDNLHKGDRVVVRGRIHTDSYTNKDGQKVYTTEIIADEVERAQQGGGQQSGVQQGFPQQNAQGYPQQGYQQQPPQGYAQAPQGGQLPGFQNADNDIPF